jgi:integrase
MAGCGLRVSEVAALKVEHMDGAGGYLHVVNGKGGKQRTSILPKPVLEALGAYLQSREDGYYLRGQGSGPYLHQADPEATG